MTPLRAPSDANAIAFLLRLAGLRQVIPLILIMAGISLTDGFGVLALVPILAGLDHNDASNGWARRIEAILGFVPSIGAMLAFIVALAIVRALLMYAQRIRSLAIQHKVVDALRRQAFAGVLNSEWRWLVQSRASDHANLIITNVARVGQGLSQVTNAIALGIAALGYVAAAFLLSWKVALLTIAMGGLVIASFAAHRRRAVQLGFATGRASKALHAYIQQGFAGVRIIKAYGIEDKQTSGFATALAAVRGQEMRNERLGGFGQGMLQVGGTIVLALMLGVGHLVWRVPLPTLLPLLLIFARLAPMLGALQSSWSIWGHSRAALTEMQQFLDQAGAAQEPRDDAAVAAPALRHAIELQAVGVTYAGRDTAALTNISLTLPANSTTALCGASGAGKSTLADLLMGLIAPDSGRLLIDGIAIEGVTRVAWRHAVAYVQQDPFLFHDTIRANILLGRNGIAPDRIEYALARAGANFVLSLPKGLDTIVGDGGARLSGGERQRVALARALVGSPALVILDEATSALDADHEMEVRRTMRALRGQVTLLFISHRESMREDADQIIMLQNGRIQ